MPGRDTNIGAKRAREARVQLGLADGAPATCLLTRVEQDLGVPVVVAALPAGIAGCCWREGERVVLWVDGAQAVVRRRFTLAHELGHVRCGHGGRVDVDRWSTLAGTTSDAREVQANAFAAELLAPAAGVRAGVAREPTLDDVVRIAARYGISTVAAVHRLSTLGLTRRAATLRREVEQGLAEAVRARLAPPEVRDVLAAIDERALPRLSPALADGALASLRDRTSSLTAAAGAAGCEPARLASGARAIGV
jgi:Zn-dependent peptidase ImmA (M78 family)